MPGSKNNEILETILTFFESMGQAVFAFEGDRCVECNQTAIDLFHLSRQSLLQAGPFAHALETQPDGKPSKNEIADHLLAVERARPHCFSWRFQRKDGTLFEQEVVLDRIAVAGTRIIIAVFNDRSKEAVLVQALQKAETERAVMAQRIESLNAALRAMAENREIEKRAIEVDLTDNLKKLILPYLAKMAACAHDGNCRALYHAIERNLSLLLSRSHETQPQIFEKLNPNEVKIAEMIRQGKATKEIAQMLHLSPSSVCWYRNQIREKLGLVSSKTKLRSFLVQSLSANSFCGSAPRLLPA